MTKNSPPPIRQIKKPEHSLLFGLFNFNNHHRFVAAPPERNAITKR